MPQDPPGFWSAKPGTSVAARLLSPLGQLYHWEVQRRLAGGPRYKADVPVICVGNATMGGVGKTPFVRWLGAKLQDAGRSPHVLTRGYGGSEKGPLRVSAEHSAAQVGDEPLLLARDLPVWVSRDRPAGAAAASADDADVIVMDDGLQNPSIAKDRSFLLIDAEARFGNGEVFPAGPLRENPVAARARSHAVVAMLPDAEAKTPLSLRHFAEGLPLIEAWFEIDQTSIPDAPLIALCGIGRPQRFFHSLQDAGADVLDYLAFPDHHPFSEGELETVRDDARRLGAKIVVTEKDLVRIPADLRTGLTPVIGGIKVRDETPVDLVLETL